MKGLSLIVFATTMALAQALAFSTLAQVSLTLMSLNEPAHGIFGMFRRRQSPVQSMIKEESFAPEGPVEFPASDLQRRTDVFRSFGGGNRFISGFPSIPNFPGGMFQTGFRPFWPFSLPGNALQPNVQAQFMSNPAAFQHTPQSEPEPEREVRSADQPQINTEEAESFFTLLAETDENKCISRLVCELGADSEGAGELGSTISEIIGSLTDFPSGSKVSEYNQVLQKGRTQGMSSCASQFSACDEESYMLMKNSQADQATETTESS